MKKIILYFFIGFNILLSCEQEFSEYVIQQNRIDTKYIEYSMLLKESMFINDNPALIVDWSSKAGCTSVKAMLLKAYGLLQEALKQDERFFDCIHSYFENFYVPNHPVTISKFFNKNYCKVKFVRNPYHRAVSSYLHAGKYFEFRGSFENFLLCYKHQKWGNLSDLNIYGIEIHTKKQYKWSDKLMDYIIQIENPDLTAVNKRTGLNLSLKKIESFHHNVYSGNCNSCLANVSFTHLDKYPPFYCYYSTQTLKLVKELFKEDIENYGYTLPQEIINFINKNEH